MGDGEGACIEHWVMGRTGGQGPGTTISGMGSKPQSPLDKACLPTSIFRLCPQSCPELRFGTLPPKAGSI